MIYTYKAKVKATTRSRCLDPYTEEFLRGAGNFFLARWFYYFNHDLYDPVLIWNMKDLSKIVLEFGNNRYIGKMIRAERGEEIWLDANFISPYPWNKTIDDLEVGDLIRTTDRVDFPTNMEDLMTVGEFQGKLYEEVVRPTLRNANLSSRFFNISAPGKPLLHEGYTVAKAFAKRVLPHHYIIKMDGKDRDMLGEGSRPLKKIYTVEEYGGIIPAVTEMFFDAKETME